MYRQGGYYSFGSMLTPGIKTIIIANAIVFVLGIFPAIYNGLIQQFALFPAFVFPGFELWRLVTYMFLHGGFMHVGFNMFALWMFGVSLERIWGTREFYKFYFATGIIAGVFSVLANWGTFIPIIGASGAVYGILIAAAMFFPDEEVYLYFLFPIKLKYFVLGLGMLEFISSMSINNDGIAHFAHLGGMIAGYFYLKHRYGNRISGFNDWFKKKF